MKKTGFVVLFLLFFCVTEAQVIPVYSQCILNPYLLNPAIAGIAECGIVQLMSRRQWIGIKDAPLTSILSYHQKISNAGIGGYVFNDHNGNTNNIGYQLTYAYHIRLNRNKGYKSKDKQLSFGISVNGVDKTINENSFSQVNGDPLISGKINRTYRTNGDIGVYYTQNDFFAGLSCANLIPVSYGIYSIQRTYFLQIGKTLYLNRKIAFEPSITSLINKEWDWNMDINSKFCYIDKKTTVGFIALSLRNNMSTAISESISLMVIAGYNQSRYSVGIAYEYGLNQIWGQSCGTGEVMIAYKFCHTSDICYCPAYKQYSRPSKHH